MDCKEYFDEVAPQWDRLRESFFTRTVRDKAISVADVQPSRIAADIGCGTGFITEGLIQRDVRVIAVDRSQAMLSEMNRKFSEIDRIDCRLGEASSLPIEDETVDYAFANMYLHHVEIPLQAIMEMVRILKPGGMLVITDLDKHNFEFLRREHNDLWMGFKREEIRSWLEDAGIRDVALDCVGESCCAESSCRTEHAKINIFVASGKKS
ncbi:MAG: methyltransferase domain-containing protein [Methanothrix sp.]|jgi:ubiquinone/menaquinone biosynthesis C-methylase UbiE